jgi:hypothetical protein
MIANKSFEKCSESYIICNKTFSGDQPCLLLTAENQRFGDIIPDETLPASESLIFYSTMTI